jgi:hypothetical protein
MRVDFFCFSCRLLGALLLLLSSLPDEAESFALISSTAPPIHHKVDFVGGATTTSTQPSWGLSGRRRSATLARLWPWKAAHADDGRHHPHDHPELSVNGERSTTSPSPAPASGVVEPSADPMVPANLLGPLSDSDLVQPLAPPLSYDKFLRMQDKRVVVTIRYSGESGLRPYFLTVAKKLKASHPDVVIERRILPSLEKDGTAEALFEILVDGKVVIGKKNRTRRQRVSMDVARSRSVFVSMQELDVAVSRARRRRRPTTAYGGAEE